MCVDFCGSDATGASDILKLESIRKPFVTGLLFEGDEFRPQQLVTASCRFELTYSDDREHCFVRNILRGIDGQVEFDPFEASEWTTLAESKYGDFVFCTVVSGYDLLTPVPLSTYYVPYEFNVVY
jgi:hypothetical protein